MEDHILSPVKELISRSKNIAVLTGAGISAESGIPTFRGKDGLWNNYRAEELATPEAFSRDPRLVWKFYNWRRALISKKSYNRAHKALAIMERNVPHFTLITQNVDGLHQKAGSRNVLELHGNIWKVRCIECNFEDIDETPDLGELPRCKRCGGLLRPGVVWFGESLDPDILERAIKACRESELMLVVGTSSVVQPAASLSLEAKQRGAVVVEINLEDTPYSRYMDYTIRGKAGEIIPELISKWQ